VQPDLNEQNPTEKANKNVLHAYTQHVCSDGEFTVQHVVSNFALMLQTRYPLVRPYLCL